MNNMGKGLAAAAWLCVVSFGGNERGGGVPPPPIFAEEDVTYECKLTLTQLNEDLGEPLISHSTQTLKWNKGEHMGNRSVELKDVSDWKHYQLVQIGPFRPTEEEVKELPDGALFSGYVGISPDGFAVFSKLPMKLSTVVYSNDNQAKLRTVSESTETKDLQSKEPLETQTKLTIERGNGNIVDQRILEADCRRKK